ncbi:MAG: electron transfer flavoprotein subunit alpha/FixB family protein [Lachnospiraceae bacterium]|nr:electron transfer flavoprotein subunit alpha/FixB family protein [Lachnospiraceae bacterium]
MMESKKEIWVFAECSRGAALPVVSELIAKAQEISGGIEGSSVAAVILGGDSAAVSQLSGLEIAKIYCMQHEALKDYRCDVYAAALQKMVEEYRPEYFFFGATAMGAELAPTTAALLKTGLAAHCIDLRWNGERLNCMVPAFGGKVVSEIYIPNARPIMASVRPGILGGTPAGRSDSAAPELVTADASFLGEFDSAEEFLEFIPSQKKDDAVEDAKIVVSAGRGVSTDKSWENVKNLAAKLGGSVAWSRSFIDTGRVDDESSMIGTSGKALSADLLINVGVSGATQYTCGTEKCKTIISINRDPRAKIFEHSDYGVVGDAEKILDAVLRKMA